MSRWRWLLFEPGARTAWHSHPFGQTLIVTTGCGWVQREGEDKQEIHPGDVVYFFPDEKHWHGASATTAMSHVAVQEKLNGSPVDWMEQVTDEQYNSVIKRKITMEKRKFGKSGLEVSAIGLGCMGMSFGYGEVHDKKEMIPLIRSAVEQGVTFSIRLKFTARLLMKNWSARHLPPFKGGVVIATKFGFAPSASDTTRWSELRQPGLKI